MKQHKWHKEIKAWADGAEVEVKHIAENEWENFEGDWSLTEGYEFRIKEESEYSEHGWKIDEIDENGFYHWKKIKPQPKEENELNYYLRDNETPLECIKRNRKDLSILMKYLEKCVKQKEELQSQLKPQPKEPQYLYVYLDDDNRCAFTTETFNEKDIAWEYIGKIKLELENE